MTSRGCDRAPTSACDGVSPKRPKRSPKGRGRSVPAAGMITSTAIRVQARDATDSTAPAIHRRWRTMIQTPRMATASPTCSFPIRARAAATPSTQSLRTSAAQMASMSSGAASVTACRSVTTAHWMGAYSSHISAPATARRSSPSHLRPSRNAGTAPAATITACATSRGTAEWVIHCRGTSTTSSGSTCDPSREACSPAAFVAMRKSPCAVLQMAWTMFPRSKRPVHQPSCRATESHENSAAHVAASTSTSVSGRSRTRRQRRMRCDARPLLMADRGSGPRMPPRRRTPAPRRSGTGASPRSGPPRPRREPAGRAPVPAPHRARRGPTAR